MSKITIKGGWKPLIYDIASKIIVPCFLCKKDIDLKGHDFCCIREVFYEKEEVIFVCSDCFSKVRNFLKELYKP